MSSADNIFHSKDWDDGLVCIECDKPFVEGQPICEVLESVGELGDEPCVIVTIVCFDCSLGMLDKASTV